MDVLDTLHEDPSYALLHWSSALQVHSCACNGNKSVTQSHNIFGVILKEKNALKSPQEMQRQTHPNPHKNADSGKGTLTQISIRNQVLHYLREDLHSNFYEKISIT